jgi:hypothetical protein
MTYHIESHDESITKTVLVLWKRENELLDEAHRLDVVASEVIKDNPQIDWVELADLLHKQKV